MEAVAKDQEVKLIGAYYSRFVLRAKIALNIKGINYEILEEARGKKSDLLLKSNPIYKKIPVLLHRGKPICESMIIVQYIDETWPETGPAILPLDPCDRAVARFWAFYIDDKIFPLLMEILKALADKEATEKAAEQALPGLALLEEAFEKCSKGKPFFGGDTIGYVDIALGSYARWIKVAEILSGKQLLSKEKTPLLHGWAERFCNDVAVEKDMPGIEELVEYAKMSQARWAGAK